MANNQATNENNRRQMVYESLAPYAADPAVQRYLRGSGSIFDIQGQNYHNVRSLIARQGFNPETFIRSTSSEQLDRNGGGGGGAVGAQQYLPPRSGGADTGWLSGDNYASGYTAPPAAPAAAPTSGPVAAPQGGPGPAPTGMRYDVPLGNNGGFEQHGAGQEGPTALRPAIAPTYNAQQGGSYLDNFLNPDFRRAALMRRLGINSSSRNPLQMWRAERLPGLAEGFSTAAGAGGGQTMDALLDRFIGGYQGGDFGGMLRGAGQGLLENRRALSDMPLPELMQIL